MTEPNPYAPPTAETEEDERPPQGSGPVRGWLSFFCFSLMYFTPLVFVASTYNEWKQTVDKFDTMPGLQATVLAETALGGMVTALGFTAGRKLKNIHRGAPRFAKQYLAATAGVAIALGIIPQVLMPSMSAESRAAVVSFATKNAARTLVFCTIWFLYLTQSQQVKTLFPD